MCRDICLPFLFDLVHLFSLFTAFFTIATTILLAILHSTLPYHDGRVRFGSERLVSRFPSFPFEIQVNCNFFLGCIHRASMMLYIYVQNEVIISIFSFSNLHLTKRSSTSSPSSFSYHRSFVNIDTHQNEM
jgi:hypothetical protein